ncbi:50S ribosomal protein L29 [Patescibacteria group bacterium]|nr:50S ribosomal protein L29 [Patescibacteria group bacterium]MBU2158665.1 50S ribosomal protein L29 [Patescibacteria group bacterium]MBU2220340.1 50S ribosomal protein L29 [Patescibacteria group bacterium]
MAKKLSFKDKKPEEIQKLLTEKREELRSLRFAAAGARPKDASAAAKVRKDIARLLTEETAQKNA